MEIVMTLEKSFDWFHNGQVSLTVVGDWIENSYVSITLSNGKNYTRKVRFDTTACDLSFVLQNQKFYLMDFNE